MPHHASEYSLFNLEEDVKERTSIEMRKKIKRRIIIGVGFSAVVLIAVLTALGLTLRFTLPPETKNVTSITDSSMSHLILIMKRLAK